MAKYIKDKMSILPTRKVIDKRIVGTTAAWRKLRDIVEPAAFRKKGMSGSYHYNVHTMRGTYKGHRLEFYGDRAGFHDVQFVYKPNAAIRRELRKLAGLKT